MISRVSMTYRAFIVILAVAALYACYEIVRFSSMNAKVASVPAQFLVRGPDEADLTIVEYLDFNCPYCKKLNEPLSDFLGIRTDIKYIAKPYPIMGEASERLARIALAAGNQDAYWEFHDAFLSNPNDITDKYIRETANLYGVNYDQLLRDSQSKEVKDLLQSIINEAQSIGIYSTPSLFIGKTLIQNFAEMPTATDLVRLTEELE